MFGEIGVKSISMKVLVCGILGKMGGNILDLLQDDGEAIAVCGVDRAKGEVRGLPVYDSFNAVDMSVDVVIDFSSPACLADELDFAIKTGTPLVLATTGYSAEQLQEIEKASEQVAIFRTANFSVGVNLLVKLVREAAELLGEKFDVEIIEKHHNQKVDAPSGTALMLADSVNKAFDNQKPYVNGREGNVGKRGNEIGMHAVRGGTIVGEHEVDFCGEDEIISLSHSARSKKVFAAGAIKAAKFMVGKTCGKYDMNDVIAGL